ncbi:MAG: alpha/beta fold hydrolase, partial [Acidimicrobiia bacterium]
MALAMAEVLAPGTFATLLLIEPIIPTGPWARESHPLGTQARRRQRSFSSKAAARDRFAGRAVFSRWQPEVLDLYVRHGLQDEQDQVVLRCDPQDEAEFYDTAGLCDVWD